MSDALSDTARLTDHARARCAEMGISTKRVKRALRSPEAFEYRGSTNHPEVEGRRVVVADGLTIVLGARDGAVVTVFWHGTESRDECRSGGVPSTE